MATQQEQLEQVSQRFKSIGDPKTLEKVYGHFDESRATLDKARASATQIGDKFPQFKLSDANGQDVSSQHLLQKGPLLITFYRGGWCPYCNIAVQNLQRQLDQFKARGVTLVAITPELPEYSATTAEKNSLKFTVLTDLHNQLARELGIVYDQSSARELHDRLGVDLKARNGEDTWEVPVPATFLVDASGTVQEAYVEVDFRKRLDPAVVLEWIDVMQGNK